MCSTPKSSSLTKLKNVPTSKLTKSELNSFISVANAVAERQEEKELLERQCLAQESLSVAAAFALTQSTAAVKCEVVPQKKSLSSRLLHSVRSALTDSHSMSVTG